MKWIVVTLITIVSLFIVCIWGSIYYANKLSHKITTGIDNHYRQNDTMIRYQNGKWDTVITKRQKPSWLK